MIEQSFLSLLSTTMAVTVISSDRVYLNARPQNERRPSLVLTRTGTSFFRTFKTAGSSVKGTVQIDCLAPDYGTAKQLAKAVRSVIDDFKGTVLNTKFHWIEIDDMSDIPIVPLEGKAEPTFGVSIDAAFMADELN